MLILDAVLEHGMDSGPGRTAIRRMNQMHRSYDISNDDLRYVLATFVVTPIRWTDRYGWRRMTAVERVASANYYRDLGHRMGIRDIPATWRSYPAGYRVEELGTFPPGCPVPRPRSAEHPGAAARK